jgi:hypothetical protein
MAASMPETNRYLREVRGRVLLAADRPAIDDRHRDAALERPP